MDWKVGSNPRRYYTCRYANVTKIVTKASVWPGYLVLECVLLFYSVFYSV